MMKPPRKRSCFYSICGLVIKEGLLSMRASRLQRATRHASAVATRVMTRGYQVPARDMRFLIYDVHKFDKHYTTLKHAAAADRETIDMVIDATKTLCENELAPIWANGDREGCTWINGTTVKTPKGYKEAYELFCESGWQGLAYPEEWGGQGLPMSMALIQSEMTATANWTFTMFPGLSKGAINTIIAHATDELKKKWLPPLVSGEFTGTMCLTEPQCGSDLGQVTTNAKPNGDGSYKINGTKIFISCGEHDMTENIVHCVLARLPGAPPGTKGISLFLVPKKQYADGAVGDFNGVTTSRIEDKMGCHGSPTCQVRDWPLMASDDI